MPTRENIDRICRDCSVQLYDNYYFNFITPIPRERLEQLAKMAVETNSVTQISKVGGGDSPQALVSSPALPPEGEPGDETVYVVSIDLVSCVIV